jgi:hypothetical protein
LRPHEERHNGTKAKVTKPTHWRGAVSPCATSTLRSRVRYAALGGYRHFFALNNAWIKSSFLKVYVVNRADRAARDVLSVRGPSAEALMPRYTFKLSDDDDGVEDDFGVSLPNAEIAYKYACDVVRELMGHRERSTRHWRLDVYQDNDEQVFAIPFVKLDNTLDHLSQDLRALVERNAQRMRSFKDTYHNATITRRESQSLVARSRGKPYLAVDRGRKVIRD